MGFNFLNMLKLLELNKEINVILHKNDLRYKSVVLEYGAGTLIIWKFLKSGDYIGDFIKIEKSKINKELILKNTNE